MATGEECKKNLLLFDIDGTLTPSRLVAPPEIVECLKEACKYFDLGIVGGSDRAKQIEQLGACADLFRWAFPENGTVAMENGKIFAQESIANFFGEERLQEIINFCLRYIADLNIPVKRGNFLEYRNGLMNASPIGRNCSQKEREAFAELNKTEKILEKFAEALTEKFAHYDIYVSVGGQISIDIFPKGWDKTYCLRFVDQKYEQIHFFGDKIHKGGNDIEIYSHPRVIGHSSVEGPKKTVEEVNALVEKAKNGTLEKDFPDKRGNYTLPCKKETEEVHCKDGVCSLENRPTCSK